MARCCTNCGEELLGAVNRCWKCGEDVLTRGGVAMPDEEAVDAADAVDADVVDADVVDAGRVVDADVVDTDTAEVLSAAAAKLDSDRSPAEAAERVSEILPGDSPPPGEATAAPILSDGVVRVQLLEPARPEGQAAPMTRYPHHLAAGGGAVSSVLLAVIGLGSFYWIPEGGIVIALLGIAMGAWGLYSHFRAWAVCGVTLCVVAFAVSGVFLTIKVHKQMFGYGPFDAPPAEVDGSGLPVDAPAPVFKQ